MTERETCVSPVSLGAARTEKDASISGTIARLHLPSPYRLPLAVTKHCHEVLGRTASWEAREPLCIFEPYGDGMA